MEKKSLHKNILLCLSTSPPVWSECFEALVLCSLTNMQKYAGSKCCFPPTPMAGTATRPSAIFHVFKRSPQWLFHTVHNLKQNELKWTPLFDSVALENWVLIWNRSHKISVRSTQTLFFAWDYWLRSVPAVFFLPLKKQNKKTTQFTWVFEVLSRTRDLFGCARLPRWFSFVCVWPWHEGAGRIGQRGAGWCQLASGHMVESHQIAITGRLWLHSDTLPLALLPVFPHPTSTLPPSATPLSLSAPACLFFTRICCFQ